jgi:hypothetical protein
MDIARIPIQWDISSFPGATSENLPIFKVNMHLWKEDWLDWKVDCL